MAELTPAETTADPCCAPEHQVACCDPSAKADCCGREESCGCEAGSGENRETARERSAD
jgi:arsenite methyltransferase